MTKYRYRSDSLPSPCPFGRGFCPEARTRTNEGRTARHHNFFSKSKPPPIPNYFINIPVINTGISNQSLVGAAIVIRPSFIFIHSFSSSPKLCSASVVELLHRERERARERKPELFFIVIHQTNNQTATEQTTPNPDCWCVCERLAFVSRLSRVNCGCCSGKSYRCLHLSTNPKRGPFPTD